MTRPATAMRSRLPPVSPMTLARTPASAARCKISVHVVGGRRHDDARRRLAEQGDGVVQPAVASDVQGLDRHFGARAACIEATLGERHRQPAIRAIVRRAHETLGGQIDHQPLQCFFRVEIQCGWHSAHQIVQRFEILTAAELTSTFAEQHDHIA